LSAGVNSSKKAAATPLALVIGGRKTPELSTPGVVQGLGNPFPPRTTFRVIADGPGNEILVRARDHGVKVEDRFASFGLRRGRAIQVTISPGSDGPTILAGGKSFTEQRILRSAR
jgi:hypothetical protein